MTTHPRKPSPARAYRDKVRADATYIRHHLIYRNGRLDDALDALSRIERKALAALSREKRAFVAGGMAARVGDHSR